MSQAGNGRETKKAIVLLTGASSGLGAALPRLLDEPLPDELVLWLIARNEKKLASFASPLRHEARILDLDLSTDLSYERLNELFAQEEPVGHLLVYNAGEGCAGTFGSQKPESHRQLCDLNVRAQLAMTSLALPFMLEGSSILFTSSVAAFLPQPGFAAYAASKAFILSFGRALREEVKKQGIRVSVTCPNPMLTEFFTAEQKEALLKSYKRFGIEDPVRVAQKTLVAMRRNKGVVVTSPVGKLIRLAAKVLPTGWLLRMISWDRAWLEEVSGP